MLVLIILVEARNFSLRWSQCNIVILMAPMIAQIS